MKTCTRCVINDSVPGVFFDRDGVCNYCHLHEKLEEDFPQGEVGEKILSETINRIKKEGQGKTYDCVIGVSGGTDSTYLLYLAKKYGLRPLAVHFDNGWNSGIAVNNIKKALSLLKIDLQTYVVDWEEFKDILVSFLKASIPWADIPTDIAITSTLYRIAAEEGLHTILVGNNFRTEGKMPTEWTYADGRMISAIQRQFGHKKIKSFPNLTLFDFVNNTLLRRTRLERPLNYVDFHKEKARQILEKEVGWVYYGGHHYESIYTRFAYSYLLPEKFKIDKRIITHSAQVRSGDMTREDALASLQEAPYPKEKVKDDVDYVIKKLGLTQAEFNQIMATPPKSFRDYPSYYPLFERFMPVIKAVFRLALPWTPPMFREMAARDRKNQSD